MDDMAVTVGKHGVRLDGHDDQINDLESSWKRVMSWVAGVCGSMLVGVVVAVAARHVR